MNLNQLALNYMLRQISKLTTNNFSYKHYLMAENHVARRLGL